LALAFVVKASALGLKELTLQRMRIHLASTQTKSCMIRLAGLDKDSNGKDHWLQSKQKEVPSEHSSFTVQVQA
jgi:hypothetical protein